MQVRSLLRAKIPTKNREKTPTRSQKLSPETKFADQLQKISRRTKKAVRRTKLRSSWAKNSENPKISSKKSQKFPQKKSRRSDKKSKFAICNPHIAPVAKSTKKSGSNCSFGAFFCNLDNEISRKKSPIHQNATEKPKQRQNFQKSLQKFRRKSEKDSPFLELCHFLQKKTKNRKARPQNK